MSVPKSKRYESSFLVCENADILYEKVVKMCVKMPKRYTELVLKDTVKLAEEITDSIHKANSIYLSKDTLYTDFIKRHSLLVDAMASLNALQAKLTRYVREPFCLKRYDPKTNKVKGVTLKELEEACSIANSEEKLLKPLIVSDINRYNSWHQDLKSNLNNETY